VVEGSLVSSVVDDDPVGTVVEVLDGSAVVDVVEESGDWAAEGAAASAPPASTSASAAARRGLHRMRPA
jgi:hypothetical protein